MLDENYELKTPYTAMAKLHVTEACKSIVDTALQCHGGYGVLADYEIERMYRDLRILRIVEGTSEIMKLIIARGIFESKF
mmetsp:Transcript_12883/g.1961  ORF Transcript_12883/g.1961 Transcript_12883/m.1961 type:complete len:80 (+) Transcript_12883:970-1209(+)